MSKLNNTPLTLEALAVRITALENTAKQNHETHGEIFARIESVEKGNAVLDASLQNIWTVLKEIQADVKEMKSRPIKRYDMIANAILQWAILAILGAAVVLK